jgi:hypothetical protein
MFQDASINVASTHVLYEQEHITPSKLAGSAFRDRNGIPLHGGLMK